MAKKVFIAGPVTGSGTYPYNLNRALQVAQFLFGQGFTPFVPHLYLQWEIQQGDLGQEQWRTLCLDWLASCDALVRIPGPSEGADHEVFVARSLGLPVFEQEEYVDVLSAARHCRNAYLNGHWGGKEADDRVHEDGSICLAVPWGDFEALQKGVEAWLVKQPFYPQDPNDPLVGMMEELGELSHAHLKSNQKIRGTFEKHLADKKDAIGDILIYMAGYCIAHDISLRECVQVAFDEVTKRDWNKNTHDGKAPSPYSDMQAGTHRAVLQEDDGEVQ